MANDKVSAIIYHLARSETYTREKPFIANFSVTGIPGGRQFNHEFAAEQVLIHNAKGQDICLNREGFMFIKYKTCVSEEAWTKKHIVETQYFGEIERLVQNLGNYNEVVFLDYQTRERSPSYPRECLSKYPDDQPLRLAHVDVTATDAVRRLKTMPPKEYAKYHGRSFDVLTIWRLRENSNDDWPLALCDYQSINPLRDVLNNDLLFPDVVAENSLLLHDSKHVWYFLKDQDVDDVIVFRNASFGNGDRPVAFHAAFQSSDIGHSRKSIEVRLAAFLK